MIDIHTHLHPPRLFKAIRRWFAENSDWNLTHPTEPEVVAESMRQFGVDRFVFCSYAHKPGMARELNSWLAATARELNRYGLPLATVHPDDEDRAAYYKEALLDGCIGLKIHEDVQKFEIDDPRLDPIHELTAAHNGFELVHVGPIPFKSDTNRGAQRVRKVLEKHPELSIVVAHLGVPDTMEYLELTREFPRLFIDTTMALSVKSPLRATIDTDKLAPFSQNILFGSDHPNLPHPYEDEVNAVKNLDMDDRLKDQIFDGNARKLLAAHL